METKTVYFDNTGAENTNEVLRIARQRAQELGIKTILVASTTGDTALKAMDVLKGFNVVAVSWATGLREPNVQKFTEEKRKIVESKGGKVLTTSHAFGGVSAAMREKFATHTIGDIIANTLRVFGHGMKVACEISLMAADSGLVRTDEDAIAIGGRSSGADTAILVRPANSSAFFDLKVREILCKPRL